MNCFEEELSDDICKAAAVEVLSLNGLHAAEGCKNSIVMPLMGVRLFGTIGGGVPPCVWRLHNLSVLHLTGNGLTGNIDELPLTGIRVRDLSLSHNMMSGSILPSILDIAKLDLSFNRFNGEYDNRANKTHDLSINLEINRLSGMLPVSQLDTMSTHYGSVRVLNGNIFSCNTIPENDHNSNRYVCGSRNLNLSLFVFVGMFSAAAFVVVVGYWMGVASDRPLIIPEGIYLKGRLNWSLFYYLKDLKVSGRIESLQFPLQRICALSYSFVFVLRVAVVLGGIILMGNIVFYSVKAADSRSAGAYTTHSNTFAWFWTMAYMHGEVPAGLLVALWVAAVSMCFYGVVLYPRKGMSDATSAKTSQQLALLCRTSEIVVTRWNYGASNVFAFIANACVTVAVNTLYVYSTQQSLGATTELCIQVSLSIFRLIYVTTIFPLLSRGLHSIVQSVRFRLILLTLNNMIIPCIVTALTSDACFQVCCRWQLQMKSTDHDIYRMNS